MARRGWSEARGILGAVVWAAAGLAEAPAARAEEAEARRARGELEPTAAQAMPSRAVGGHVFIVSPLAPAPLATTSFSSRSVLGVAEGEGRVFNVAGTEVGRAEFELAAFSERIDLQLALLGWLAIRGGIGGELYGGLETKSALALGATLRYEPTVGATASTAIGGWARVGASVDWSWANRLNLNVVRPIVESIDQRRVVTRNLVVDDRVSVLTPGVSAAFALGRTVGLVVSAQYTREDGGEDIPGVAAENTIAGGAALDVDLQPISPVPLGVLVAYRIGEPLGDEDIPRTQALDAGLFYTGRPELELGLSFGLRRFPLFAGSAADAALLTLAMRYYW